MDWQLIETAPRDGTAVLVYLYGGQIDIATWTIAHRQSKPMWIDYFYKDCCVPTHWMPLPEGPKDKQP